MSTEREYVLGTNDAELERLGLQHRIWRPRVVDAWRRAGFRVGQKLVDVGCGPGYAALDLAEIVGTTGHVHAADRSRRFLVALGASAAARGISNVATQEADLDSDDLEVREADGAWCRWVMSFVQRPRELVQRIADALKPGGVFVSFEYFNYESWRAVPPAPEHEQFVQIVMDSWRGDGGEPNIALQLPAWLDASGFDIREMRPIVEVAMPDNYLWQWPKAFIGSGAQRLVDLGRLTQKDADALGAMMTRMEKTPGACMITPGVMEIIAVKR